MTYFHRARGGAMAPSAPPWIRYCIVWAKCHFQMSVLLQQENCYVIEECSIKFNVLTAMHTTTFKEVCFRKPFSLQHGPCLHWPSPSHNNPIWWKNWNILLNDMYFFSTVFIYMYTRASNCGKSGGKWHFWWSNTYVSLQLPVQNRRRKWNFPLNFRNCIIWTSPFPLDIRNAIKWGGAFSKAFRSSEALISVLSKNVHLYDNI